jgi:hypothetical protein
MIAAASALSSSILSSCKTFYVPHYSNISKGINRKIRILAYYDKVVLDKAHNFESNVFLVMPIQLVYGTSVVLLSCPFEPEIIHERAPEVFLHQ